MDDEATAQPKIPVVDMVLVGLFLAILDVIDLIPLAGDLTDIFAAPLVFYYFFKNINGVSYVVSLVLDAIPGIQEVPTRSIVWWGTVIIDHLAPKKLEQVLEKTGELAQANEGGGADVGAANAATEGAAGAAAEGAEGAAGAETGAAATEAGAQGAETEAVEHTPADEMTPEEERNPMENLQKELEEPKENLLSDDSDHVTDKEEVEPEGGSTKDEENSTKDKIKKVIDIRSRAQSTFNSSQNQDKNVKNEDDEDESLVDEAA